MNAALTAYRQNSVDTASPGRLIVMLYDGLLTALDKTEGALAQNPIDVELSHKELTRCQDIVLELMQSLNHAAGDVAKRLATTYEYCHHQLVQANTTKDFKHAQPVRAIFTELRDAWIAIVDGTMESAQSA